tara:strand:- start:2664 stop:3560 length:897 start_codon:yes stop_codon:yes gene_type:complete
MGFTSMVSLLDKIDEKININIIHNSKDVYESIPQYIKNHKNLNSINIHFFQNEKYIFPNLDNSHVSEATYFRLFIEDYIDKSHDFLIYLDADVVCIKNPIPYFNSKIQSMIDNDFTVAAMNDPGMPEIDERSINLGIKSGRYFNAGVMIINYSKWIDQDIKTKSTQIIKEKKEKLILWDQDVLNIIFDGKFQNIDQEFNYRMDILNFSDKEISSIENNVYLIHYFGKSKPWTLKGINFGISEYYQSEFRKISKNKYHIVHKWKRDSLNYIFEIILSTKLFKLKFPFRFIVEALRSFFN